MLFTVFVCVFIPGDVTVLVIVVLVSYVVFPPTLRARAHIICTVTERQGVEAVARAVAARRRPRAHVSVCGTVLRHVVQQREPGGEDAAGVAGGAVEVSHRSRSSTGGTHCHVLVSLRMLYSCDTSFTSS